MLPAATAEISTLSHTTLFRSIGLRAHGQKDPLVEYKKESYDLFTAMTDRIEDETVRYLFFLQVSMGGGPGVPASPTRSEEHTSELQSHVNLVCRLLLEKKKSA